MKDQLRQIFTATLEQLSLRRVMREKAVCEGGVLSVGGERIALAPFKKIIGVAIGKAAFQMAEAAAEILKPRVMTGVVVGSTPAPRRLPYFLAYAGGHPYPDSQSVHAANVVQELLSGSKSHHLILYFLSGGGSAICEKPISEEISLDDCREFYRLLVTCGANIVEMNVLRKRRAFRWRRADRAGAVQEDHRRRDRKGRSANEPRAVEHRQSPQDVGRHREPGAGW